MKNVKLWIGVGGAGLLVVVMLAAAQERRAAPAKAAAGAFEVGIPTAQEVRAMLGAYGARVEENEKALADLRIELAATREQLAKAVDALSQERRRDLGALSELLRDARAEAPAAPGRFKTFDFGRAEPERTSLHLPAGSFGEATLLTGVYAPTTGEPLPVLIRLDAALAGPRRTRVPLRGAFLVGKATGEANSKRAVVQLDTISFVRADGRSIEAKVNGWVVDHDGVQGLAGEYVWRADEIAALATLAGGLSAGADAFAARETTTAVTPLGGAIGAITGDAAKFAGYRAVGETAKRFAEIVTARLNEITPAIHVTNGRRVTVAFISGVTLEGLEVDDEGAERAEPYRGLDGRR
jgi:conjugal transfer pilus assembly protein TraB